MLRQSINLQSLRYGRAILAKTTANHVGYGSTTAAGAGSQLLPLRRQQLHDMVKKRALEARFKLKSPKYPENVSCPLETQSSNAKCPNQDKPQPSKQRKDSCSNVNVLKARDCSGSAPPPPPKSNDALKWIGGLLATGCIAGAVYYLMQKPSKPEHKSAVTKEKQVFRVPETSASIPDHIPYLLIGGGTASFSAFRAIKSLDAKAKVLVITDEYFKPYMRPPLSKEMWYSVEPGQVSKDYRFKQWTGSERSLFFEPEEFFEVPDKLMENANGGIAIAQGYSVKQIDPVKKIATLSDGKQISYGQCLLATGCSPKNISIFEAAPKHVQEKVMLFRTPEDFEKLKSIADSKKSITIVGGGFLGSELACSLANYGKDKLKVNQIFHENGNVARALPEYLSQWASEKLAKLGVNIIAKTEIVDVSRDHENLKLVLNDGRTILTDQVVVCAGCEANTDIAITSGLETHSQLGGFVVNAELEARRDLFVAGDAACFYDPLLGRRRVEHHDNSVVSGRLAGENMTGEKKPYKHQSMFWSDMGPEIGFEGIGLVDSSLPTVGVFAKPSATVDRNEQPSEKTEDNKTPAEEEKDVDCPADDYGKGVIFYLKENKIVGILLWNMFNRIGLARTIINEDKCYDDLNEVAKLFDIHA